MINGRIFLLTIVVVFMSTVIITKKLIPVLARKKIGQKILEIGPNWHKSKNGTPTMGGIGFVLSITITLFIVLTIFGKELDNRENSSIINVFLYAILNGIIGMIDDIAKIRKRENEGLTPKGKLILQSIASILFLFLMSQNSVVSTSVKIPFADLEIELGFFYYIFAFLLLCGVTNAVNLTDGLDGLASTCVLSVGAFISFVGLAAIESVALCFFGASLLGAMLGFLIFNFHPAKIFMGDTGSLFLGALVVGISFAINNPLLVLIYGFVFICEALSVVLQVTYFKLTKGKRLFKMAPLHHHFEKSGYSEIKVVYLFGIISVIFCIIAFFAI